MTRTATTPFLLVDVSDCQTAVDAIDAAKRQIERLPDSVDKVRLAADIEREWTPSVANT